MQPRVSPDGRLVAFRGLPVDSAGKEFSGANRDIWVQPVAGGQRVPIATAESTDWNPVWAPDGHALYFSSDRGGTTNIWQIAVDPKTGRPSGEPLAVTAPTVYAGHMSVGWTGQLPTPRTTSARSCDRSDSTIESDIWMMRFSR